MNRNQKDLFNYYVTRYDYVLFNFNNTKRIINLGLSWGMTYIDIMQVRKSLKNHFEEI